MHCACVIFSSVAYPALQYFSTFSHKRHHFRKKKNIYWTQNAFWFSLKICLKHLSFREEFSKILSKKYFGLHVKYSLFLSDFDETWLFATDFRKVLIYHISWKSFRWELSLSMQSDGRMNMTKLTVFFFGNLRIVAKNKSI